MKERIDMKAAVDKNEYEFEKLRRESLKWMECKNVAFPPFIRMAVEHIKAEAEKEVSDEDVMLYFYKYAMQSKDMKINYQVFTRGQVLEFAKWLRDNLIKKGE
jgi:hypothetical protein